MSALADRLHAFLNRFISVGKNDVENVIMGVEEHLAPLIAQARTELLADVKALYAEAKVDEQKLATLVAAEVAKLLGHTPAQPTPSPAPVEPPAPQA
ncbi:hypothetical protein [Streptomyces sp. NPDC059928]|uniref:hypothetical protein n=1 Tax=unclassified Streptomyces TaxID=2593676 RepID=UPI003667A8EF